LESIGGGPGKEWNLGIVDLSANITAPLSHADVLQNLRLPDDTTLPRYLGWGETEDQLLVTTEHTVEALCLPSSSPSSCRNATLFRYDTGDLKGVATIHEQNKFLVAHRMGVVFKCCFNYSFHEDKDSCEVFAARSSAADAQEWQDDFTPVAILVVPEKRMVYVLCGGGSGESEPSCV
jgi:hypothetical protein